MRSAEQSIALIDSLVGRCVRDADFAEQVIADPRAALEGYDLTADELDDFLALSRDVGTGALATWSTLRGLVYGDAADGDRREAFERDGFVVVPNVFRRDELDEMRAAVDDAVERRAAAVRRHAGSETKGPVLERELTLFVNLWEDSPAVRPWTFHPRLAAIAAGLLGAERLRLLVDQALYKEPGAPGTSKHQDVTRMPVEADATLTAWIPFRGATVETGTLGYLPGSHRFGRSSHFSALFGEEWPEDVQQELQRPPVFVEVPPGGVAFHHACTFHLSAPNRGPDRRRALGIVYFRDGARRESSYPHPALDRAGIGLGQRIDATSTPLAYPLPPEVLPEPPQPLVDPPPGWPGTRSTAATEASAER